MTCTHETIKFDSVAGYWYCVECKDYVKDIKDRLEKRNKKRQDFIHGIKTNTR